MKKLMAGTTNIVSVRIDEAVHRLILIIRANRMMSISSRIVAIDGKHSLSIFLIIRTFIFIALLMLSGISYADPENVIFKSDLFWRADGKGDYLLPAVSSGIVKPSQPISTKGTIKSITANWKFEGEVTLEVSADNGAHYTLVVNGVPLTGGFTQGSGLLWRASPSADSSLEEVKISYEDASGQISNFGEPELSGFKFRKTLNITNLSGENLFNYQIQIKAGESAQAGGYDVQCENNIKADFTDIRFTCPDGVTILPYYRESIETDEAGKKTAVFWIKIPQIPPQGVSIYVYYGNSSAKDLSSAEAVFDFFDDFNDELNAGKWETVLKENSEVKIENSYLQLKNARLNAQNYKNKNGIIEYCAKADKNGEMWVIARGAGETYSETSGQVVYSSAYSGVEHCIAVGDIVKANEEKPLAADTIYDYRAILQGTNLTFQRYTQDYETQEAEIKYDDEGGSVEGILGLKAGSKGTVYFDWIRVRKYSPSEITIAGSSAAETVDLPQFLGTKLNEKGDLTLADGFNEGSYISETRTIPYEAQIFIPSCVMSDAYSAIRNTLDAIRIDISMDGGSNYASDCKADTFYYASKNDFKSGKSLKFKLSFISSGKTSADAIRNTLDAIQEVNFDCRPGTITLVSPNGGETLTQGKTYLIMWSALEYENIYPFKLEYSLDGGKTYQKITDLTLNAGSFMWTAPQESSNEAVVKISDAYAPAVVFDISDSVFSIGKSSIFDKISSVFNKTEVSEEITEGPEVLTSEVDLNEIIETGERPNTKVYDVLIKIDDPGAEAAAKTSYEGEIVMVVPSGNNWSDTERRSFLIIPAYLTDDEFQKLTAPEVIQTGKKDALGNPEVEIREKTKKHSVDLQKLGLGKTKVEKGKRNVDSINETLKEKYIDKGVLVE